MLQAAVCHFETCSTRLLSGLSDLADLFVFLEARNVSRAALEVLALGLRVASFSDFADLLVLFQAGDVAGSGLEVLAATHVVIVEALMESLRNK